VGNYLIFNKEKGWSSDHPQKQVMKTAYITPRN